MRLFFYYAFHTVINTLKKILKTWIAIFLVITVLSAILGFLIGIIVPMAVKSIKGEDTVAEEVEEKEETDKDEGPSKISVFMEERNLDKYDMVDLVVTMVFFFMITICIASANKGGQMFKPADVPILFASPMKPQSVMLFRLLCGLGANVFVSLYMLFQIPNLVNNLKISIWSALIMLLAYMLTLMFAYLLEIVIYSIACSTKKGSINIGGILLGFYAALMAVFMAYTMIMKQDILTAVFKFFGSKNTFWIPFWGWMRGIIYFSVTGNTMKSAIYLGLFVVSCIVIVILIWNAKVDFYENAMFETEKVAEKIQSQKTISKGGVAKREKERSNKIERDGFHFGMGASVFFYKAVYNRFRFAKLKIFNLTFMIYLVAAIGTGWLAGRISDPKIDLLFIPASAIAIIAFYRSLGNPLEEDTSREFFVLIPEPPLKKIWASLLGSVAVCAFDVLIPLIVAAILVKSNPLMVLAWLVFIVSSFLFSTSIGAFISLSIPGDNAQTIKMMVQMSFVIFGIVPEISFIAVGLIFKMVVPVLLLGTVFNIVVGAVFTLFSPKFLENR